MAGTGGYQAPRNPAPVSGPGKLARRTDGGPAKQPLHKLSDAAYGEQATFQAAQQAAPMAATPGPSQGAAPAPAPNASVVPMGAPTQMPAQPVTAGADAGPGPGSGVLGLPTASNGDLERLRPLMPAFEIMANSPFASQATRQWYRSLRALMP